VESRRLSISFVITFVVMILELVGGHFSGSIALTSDG
jgi:Co/Zn/Cd efflux system component